MPCLKFQLEIDENGGINDEKYQVYRKLYLCIQIENEVEMIESKVKIIRGISNT